MTSEARVEQLRVRLQQGLQPTALKIIDESARHAGHAGAASGGGHFIVHIVAAAFAGKSPMQRHRLVYEVVGDMMQHEIHALSIHARTPEES
jgi:BolA protein